MVASVKGEGFPRLAGEAHHLLGDREWSPGGGPGYGAICGVRKGHCSECGASNPQSRAERLLRRGFQGGF